MLATESVVGYKEGDRALEKRVAGWRKDIVRRGEEGEGKEAKEKSDEES